MSQLKKGDGVVVASLEIVEESDFGFEARLFSRQRAGFSIVLPKFRLVGEIRQLKDAAGFGR